MLLERLHCRKATVSDSSEATQRAIQSEVVFDIIMMETNLSEINDSDVTRMIRDKPNINS
jgi:hypothetical protein